MLTSYTLTKSTHYGKFATTARLISCLIIEDLVAAYYYTNDRHQESDENSMAGLCLVLRPYTNNSLPRVADDTKLASLDQLLALVPLRTPPEFILDKSIVLNGIQCPKVRLVDPWDMLPQVYAPRRDEAIFTGSEPCIIANSEAIRDQTVKILRKIGLEVQDESLESGYDAVQLWSQFAKDTGVDKKPNSESIALELANSMVNQTYTYEHPKPLPTFKSSPIQWEQSILEGHPNHPMHKLRLSFDPLPTIEPGKFNLENPTLRLISVPKSSMKLRGDFELLATPLVDAMLKKTGNVDEQRAQHADRVFVPIHEFQIPNIQAKFHDAVLLPEENSVVAHCLTTIRSVAVPEVLPNMSIKLCVGIKVTSAMRVITPFSAHFGPGFSANVVPRLTYDRSILTVEREMASAIYRHEDKDIAKHCSCILREAVEYPSNPGPEDDIFVVGAALVEKIQKPDTRETLLTHVWKLDTEEKRAKFLERYIRLALEAFIPPCRENGVAFEAHGQNTLARFDRRTRELKGFVIRDFGAIRVHNDTLKRTCGVEIDVLPGSPVNAESMDLVYNRLYHTLFYTHLQRIIRVLDMHHNGRGWEMVRKHFSELVPADDPMYDYFMQDTISGKCFARMRMDDLYRDYIYRPVPNVMLSRPQNLA